MKRMLTGLLAAVLLAVVGLAVAAGMQPDVTHIERSRHIATAPADVLGIAADYSRSQAWSPWAELDPNQVVTLSDPAAGVGAWYTWEGNDKVGKGKMTITAVDGEHVASRLEFYEPWQSVADTAIAAIPDGDGAKVTWSYDEQAGFMSKVMGVFMNMDAMLGPDFEKGLGMLEPLAVQAKDDRIAAEAAAEAARLAAEAEAAGAEAEAITASE